MKKFSRMTLAIMVLTIFSLTMGLTSTRQAAAQSKEPVKIGAILPLTGGAATAGKNIIGGMEMAVDEINQLGGLLGGRPLKLIVEDCESRPKAGMDAVHKLVDIEKVPIILGSYSSSVTIPTSTYSNSKKVVQIGLTATSPTLRTIGPYYFSMYATDEIMAADMVKFAMQDSGQKNFSMLLMNDDFGVSLGKAMRKTIETQGGKVLSEVRYEKNKNDYKAELQRCFAPNPPAVLSIAWYETSRIIQKQAYELGLYQKVKESWYSPYINIAVAKCIPETIEGRKGIRTLVTKERRVEEFNEKYRKKIGDPDATAAMYPLVGYDSVWVTALSIMMGGSADSEKIKNTLPKAFDIYRGLSDENMAVDEDGIQFTQVYTRQVYRSGKLENYEDK